jgi:O-antigen/teichoic acid export membrane protein
VNALNDEMLATRIDSALPPLDVASVPRLSLRRNFAWAFVGNSALALSQWFVLIAIVKWGTAAAAGQVGIALAISGPIMMFANLNLRALQATDASGRFTFSEFFVLRFITSLLAVVAMVAVAEGLRFFRPLSDSATMCVWAIAVVKFFESQSDIVYGALQHQERMDGIGKSQILKTVLILAIVAVVAQQTGNAPAVLAATAIVRAACFFFYDLPACRRLNVRWNGWLELFRPNLTRTWKLILTALPLGFVMLLISLNTNVPRYFLMHFADENLIGVFVGMTYLPIVCGRIFLAMGQAASPRLSKYFATSDFVSFLRLMRQLLLMAGATGLALVAISFLAGEVLLRWVYSAEFAVHWREFVVVAVASAVGFAASFAGVGLTAMGQIRWQPWILGVVLVVQTACCSWAIPRWGLHGAAGSLVAANLAQFGLMAGAGIVQLRIRRRSLAYSGLGGCGT